MLKTKLNTQKYKMIPYDKWDLYLTFTRPSDKDDVDPCFLGRVAYMSMEMQKVLGAKWTKFNVSSGYRGDPEQEQIFFARGGKYSKEKGYYWEDSVPLAKRTVAKPGRSKHGKRLAIDTNTPWAKAIDKNASFATQSILAKFGLCKPMTKGNGSSVLEDWHIQPVETINATDEQIKNLIPIK